MKLLIADTLPQSHVETLRKIVGEVEYHPELTDKSLVDHIRGAKILVVRGRRFERKRLRWGMIWNL